MTNLDESSYRLPETWGGRNNSDEFSFLDHRSRISKIQQLPGNLTCADCSCAEPQWASLLLNEEEGNVEGLGVLVCQECALHHLQELGEERCFLKFLQYFHEWTTPELDILENSGNTVVNDVYEALLEEDEDQREARETTARKQAKFIKNKYRRCKYMDEDRLSMALEAIEARTKKVEAMRRRRNSLEFSARRGSMQSGQSSNHRRQGSDLSDTRRSSMDNTGSYHSENSMDRSLSIYNIDCSVHSEALSMADSLMGSSCFSFDLEDTEDFFLACARATPVASPANGLTLKKSTSAPSLGVSDQPKPTTNRRIPRSDRTPRRPRRRCSNDPGKYPYHAQMPIRRGRKNMLQRMLTNPDNKVVVNPPLRRSQTDPAPKTSTVNPALDRVEEETKVTTTPSRPRSISPVRRPSFHRAASHARSA